MFFIEVLTGKIRRSKEQYKCGDCKLTADSTAQNNKFEIIDCTISDNKCINPDSCYLVPATEAKNEKPATPATCASKCSYCCISTDNTTVTNKNDNVIETVCGSAKKKK